MKGRLSIIHFNDVYELRESTKPVCGGASRFVALVKQLKSEHKAMVLFSGDLFNPSKLAMTFQGEHMILPVNELGLTAAAVGNHDLDLGEEKAVGLVAKCNFPWILSNVKMVEGKAVAGSVDHVIVTHQGYKIGILGLAEEGWVQTLSQYNAAELDFRDPVDCGDRLAELLKKEEGCDLVVGLTHMRQNNDRRMARECKHIDIFLGGHDHVYYIDKIGMNLVVKSGCEFRNLSLIHLEPRDSPAEELLQREDVNEENVVTGKEYRYYVREQYLATIVKYDVTLDIIPDPLVEAHVRDSYLEFDKSMSRPICLNAAETIDATFKTIRTQEAGIGNFLADLMRKEHQADCAIINSGTIRADKVYPKGPLTIGDWNEILPFAVGIVLLSISGSELLQVLEAAVAKYPALEGRFPQVSNISFEFDPTRPPLSRINLDSLTVKNTPIDLDRFYTLACTNFIGAGKDGYDTLKDCVNIIDRVEAPELKTIITLFFHMMKDPLKQLEFQYCQLHPDVMALSYDSNHEEEDGIRPALLKVKSSTPVFKDRSDFQLNKVASQSGLKEIHQLETFEEGDLHGVELSRNMSKRLSKYSLISFDSSFSKSESMDSKDSETRHLPRINPVVEGRIRIVLNKEKQEDPSNIFN